jgi:hypothetical protein
MAQLPPLEITKTNTAKIYCCGCKKVIEAYETTGDKIYPSRKDLASLKFYRCPICFNYVGTHKAGNKKGEPLGSIPTPQVRRYRKELHDLLDPIWNSGKLNRAATYALISDNLGFEFHTASIKDEDDYKIAKEVIEDIRCAYDIDQ